MKKIVDYVLSCIYLFYFGVVLLVFHVLQVVAFTSMGKPAQKRVVDWMNAAIAYGWYLTGSTIAYRPLAAIPENRPLIIVANHQSMFDISPLIWFMRAHTPIFVSKKELAYGIPGISYNLRKSHAALIDRKDHKQAIAEIARLAKHIEQTKHAVVIFPEGTRSASGQMRPFAPGGLAVLLKRAPSALIVPVAIRGTGRFNPKGLFPLRSFTTMSWTVLPAIDPAGRTVDDIVSQTQEAIRTELAGAV